LVKSIFIINPVEFIEKDNDLWETIH
jgi:hypothetical protein